MTVSAIFRWDGIKSRFPSLQLSRWRVRGTGYLDACAGLSSPRVVAFKVFDTTLQRPAGTTLLNLGARIDKRKSCEV